MALEAGALATVEDCRDYLGDATAGLEALELLINGKSAAIHRWTRREFLPQSTATRTFAYAGAGIVSFAPFDLRSVSAITLDGTTVEAAGYELGPVGGTELSTYLWATMRTRFDADPAVAITGEWGACADRAAVPGEVRLACLIAVAQGWRNPEGFAGRSLGELDFTTGPSELDEPGLPLASRQLLYPWRRNILI